jgi:L-asparagine transporter-like permease
MTITGSSFGGEKASDTVSSSQHLQRKLTERQLSMIAIGGAIGVGLFLGSNVTINLAGPSVIITYLLGAVLALIMAYSLAEMAVVHPVAGSFGFRRLRNGSGSPWYLCWLYVLMRRTSGILESSNTGSRW